MSNYNRITLVGRITAQPEQRYTQTGKPVTTFNLAVNRQTRKEEHPEADFIPIVAWQKLAEICSQYLVKGQLILIEGKLSTRLYNTQDGQKRKVFEVVASDMRMLGRKNENANGNGNGGQCENHNSQSPGNDPNWDVGGYDNTSTQPPQEAQWGPEQFDQAAQSIMEDDMPF